MKHYSIYVELDITAPTESKIVEVREFVSQLGYSPAVGTSPSNRLDVQITVAAGNLYEATARGVVAVQQLAGGSAVRIEALPEADYEANQGFDQIPDMVSVAQASEVLGVSRQRVQQLIDAGQFRTARKVGNVTALAMTEVYMKANPTKHSDVIEEQG